MSKRNIRATSVPVSEGVRFEIGSASAFAVRNRRHSVSVHVAQQTHFFRDVFFAVPFLRGVLRLLGTPVRLLSSMSFASDMNAQDTARGSRLLRSVAHLFDTEPEKLCGLFSLLWIPIILIGLNALLPMFISELLLKYAPELTNLGNNLICLLFRIFGFLTSIWLTAHLRIFRRTAMYRGAANKVLNAYNSARGEMTFDLLAEAELISGCSDGAFCVLVLLLALIAGAFLPYYPIGTLAITRLLLLCGTAAVVNEFVRPLEGRRPGTLSYALSLPLRALERLFTLQPTEAMLEVANEAFLAAYKNDAE